MTEQRTMNSIIHAAFRRDLRRFNSALGSFPAGSGERAVQLKAAWDHLAYQLRLHQRGRGGLLLAGAAGIGRR